MAGVSGTDERHRLTALTGTVGLGLDALASVAYGPEVVVLVLAGWRYRMPLRATASAEVPATTAVVP